MKETSFRSNLWKMYLFRFFVSLHFIGGVLVPFFTDWGGLSFTQIMILQSWFMLWICILEIPTGTIADYLGRKHSLVFACGVTIIGVLVYVSKPSFYVFLIGEFLWAVGQALLSGADEALVYDTLKETGEDDKSKKVFGRMASFGLAGIMIGAPIGSIVAARFGLRAPMLLIAVPSAIALIIATSLREPEVDRRKEKKSSFSILKDGISFFYRHKILRILALDLTVLSSVAYFMIWVYQPLLKQAGVSIAYFGVVHAVFAGSQILIMSNYERLEKVLGSKKHLMFFSAAITGVMFIVGGITTSVPVVLLVIVLGGGFGLSRRPLILSYMNKYIQSSERATILSTVSMMRRLVLVVVSPVVGIFVDRSLSYTLIVLGAVALAFSFLSRVREEHLLD